jgi:hypothetical protein
MQYSNFQLSILNIKQTVKTNPLILWIGNTPKCLRMFVTCSVILFKNLVFWNELISFWPVDWTELFSSLLYLNLWWKDSQQSSVEWLWIVNKKLKLQKVKIRQHNKTHHYHHCNKTPFLATCRTLPSIKGLTVVELQFLTGSEHDMKIVTCMWYKNQGNINLYFSKLFTLSWYIHHMKHRNTF